MLVASLTHSITNFIGNHGVYAVFLLMAIDAVFPAFSEAVMVYAGALAAGAFSGQHVVLFGDRVHSHFWGFVVIMIGMLTFNFEAWGLDLRWLDLRARMEGRVQIVQAREPGETNQISKHAPLKAGPVPAIKIQGIIFKSEHPVVLIDGESYRVGESVDDAVIQAITRESIVVQIGGEARTIHMGAGRGMNGVPAGRK